LISDLPTSLQHHAVTLCCLKVKHVIITVSFHTEGDEVKLTIVPVTLITRGRELANNELQTVRKEAILAQLDAPPTAIACGTETHRESYQSE
jgi:hypothetical protein